ncbi:MAG: sugar transferase [Fibrobacter sp.]|nr:sugar transferase [Fibrobacter sp.]
MYRNFFKRIIDFFCALLAIVCLSPVLVVLTILGAIKMKGNPFFTQLRPGKNEKIFKLIKFRTMTCEADANGKLLPDEVRLTSYGKFLRSTSLDELPELFNILKGDMAVIGPRPLLVEYLPYYNEREHHRHDIRPGLSGWAQVNGRNSLKWDDRFEYDVQYVENLTFMKDVEIVFKTFKKVFCRSGIAEDTNRIEGNFAEIRKKQMKEKGGA